MDYWGSLLSESAGYKDNKLNAIDGTTSRLYELSDDCAHESNRLRERVMAHDDNFQAAVVEFVKVLGECRNE